MPTGYTAGIINGDINTFEEFAKKCMRAFGATIHMRDDDPDKEYEPREPGDYHPNKIREIENEIEKIESLSNEQITQLRTDELREEISRIREQLKKNQKVKKRLTRMLADVQEWIPPTPTHQKFKEFMADQIEKTIEFDTNPSWKEARLKDCEEEITTVIGEFERKRRLEKLNKDLQYHKDELNKEIERCKEANEWVQKLLESL